MVLTSASPLGLLVAIENAVTRKLIISLLREIGNANITETKDKDHTLLHLRRGATTKIDLIICDNLGGNGHLAVLKLVRWEQGLFLSSLPVICVAEQWTGDDLIIARDAGISSTLTLPLTKRSLDMAMMAALSPQKAFVACATFRGPDRRAATIKGYKGPFRRADDAQTQRAPGSPLITPASVGSSVAESPSAPGVNAEFQAEFEWTMAIATGREDIDGQHKKIIDFINILSKKPDNDCNEDLIFSVISGLKDYIKTHFAYEEGLMHTFDYDDRDHHIHLHTEFTARVDSLSDDAFTDDDKRLKLLFAIYNWLVSHIAGIDRVMIAKMNGEYDDGFNSDTNHKQTRLVINNAYLSATQIAQISVQLKRARGRYRQSQLSRQIADATERLINLMSLADSRIEVTGCNAFQLRRLSEIRAAVASNANALAETAARRIIEYGASILSGKYGLPLGVGAIMERHLDRVSALVAAIGGTEAMSPSAKATTQEAITIANAVFAMEEASSTVLPELIARDQAI